MTVVGGGITLACRYLLLWSDPRRRPGAKLGGFLFGGRVIGCSYLVEACFFVFDWGSYLCCDALGYVESSPAEAGVNYFR